MLTHDYVIAEMEHQLRPMGNFTPVQSKMEHHLKLMTVSKYKLAEAERINCDRCNSNAPHHPCPYDVA